jgi:hypothetical protein
LQNGTLTIMTFWDKLEIDPAEDIVAKQFSPVQCQLLCLAITLFGKGLLFDRLLANYCVANG